MNKIKHFIKKRGSTLFLRASLFGIACIVVFFSSLMVVNVYSNWAEQSPELKGWRFPIILVIFSVVITLFVAFRQIWRLLGLVDKRKAFSQTSVDAMRTVKYCGFIISGLFVTWAPLVLHTANNDDAPGLIILFGTVFIVIPFVVGVLAGIAQKLFQNAVDIKKENDLTV